jgi:putative salt-induced outer membrane protein YdiY
MIFVPALVGWGGKEEERIVAMRKTIVFALAFWLILCLSAWGWSEEAKEEPPHWKGDVSLGLSLARGNSRSSSFSFTFSADGPINQAKTLLWLNKAIYLFGESEGETSADNLLVSTRLNWQHTPRLYSYYELQGLRDRFKNYSYRIMPAVGVGYKIIAQKTVTMGLDAGLSEVFTEYYDSGDTDNYLGLKLGEELIWKIAETSEFNEKLEIDPDLSDFSRYFMRFEANLITAIAKSWSVKLTFIDTYDSQPVGVGVEKNDMVFIAGLSRKF